MLSLAALSRGFGDFLKKAKILDQMRGPVQKVELTGERGDSASAANKALRGVREGKNQ
jgi:hypothetical protein